MPPAVALARLDPSFSELAITSLFRACKADPESCWRNDSIIAAIESLQDATEDGCGVAAARRALLGKIRAGAGSQ